MYESAPPTHFGVEPRARASTSRTVAWVVALAAAVGVLIWLTLKLPSFAMDETHRMTNEAIMAKSHAALAGGATKPPPAATDLACSPPATTEPTGPAASPPDKAARRSGTRAADAIAVTKDQAGATTTAKQTKPSAKSVIPLKPSSPARAPAPRPVMASNPDSVYPDPDPVPAPSTPAAEGEIFNRPPSPN